MQPAPPYSTPACWWWMQVLGVAVRCVVCGFYLFILPPIYIPLWDSKTPHRPTSESVFWCLETSLLLRLPSQMDLCLYLFCLAFYHLSFVLPPFENNGLPFWVPDVLCQHSEVVLWNLFSVQMFFQWICWGESSLPVLFLHHLRTASSSGLLP